MKKHIVLGENRIEHEKGVYRWYVKGTKGAIASDTDLLKLFQTAIRVAGPNEWLDELDTDNLETVVNELIKTMDL